jgi:hypothetical protein
MSAADVCFEKNMPNSVESERAVLGAILLDGKAIFAAAEILTSDDFYLEAHREIFRAMLALAEEEISIDCFTLREEVRRRDKEEMAGGTALLSRTRSRSPEVSTTAFRTQPPNLRRARLMDIDFAVIGQFVSRPSPLFGSCPSAHAFARRFLQTPPRDGRPCAPLPFTSIRLVEDFHFRAVVPARHTYSLFAPAGAFIPTSESRINQHLKFLAL